MEAVISESISVTPAPVQFASVIAFDKFEEIRETYLSHCNFILQTISKKMFEIFQNAHISTHPPEGGFYFFLSFENHKKHLQKKGISNSQKLCDTILQEDLVATLPGLSFGRKEEELSLRLSFVDFDGKKMLDFVQRNSGKKLSEEEMLCLASNCIDGANKIADWLKNKLK